MWWFESKCPPDAHIFEFLVIKEWHYLVGFVGVYLLGYVWPLIEELCYWGQALRFQKIKLGPVTLIYGCLWAAYGSTYRTICYFFNDMSVYMPSCSRHD